MPAALLRLRLTCWQVTDKPGSCGTPPKLSPNPPQSPRMAYINLSQTNLMAKHNLTEKEQALYDAIKAGMDAPGEGWLHEVTPFNNDHVTAGVLASLIKKELVHSYEDLDGVQPCYWVKLI